MHNIFAYIYIEYVNFIYSRQQAVVNVIRGEYCKRMEEKIISVVSRCFVNMRDMIMPGERIKLLVISQLAEIKNTNSYVDKMISRINYLTKVCASLFVILRHFKENNEVSAKKMLTTSNTYSRRLARKRHLLSMI